MPSNTNKQVVCAFRFHKPPILQWKLWCLVAAVEDEVQIDRADQERKSYFGGGVGSQDMAALGLRSTEVLKLVDICDNQRAVVVEDVKDSEPILAPVIPEVWNAVVAMDLKA
ncbi:hypothetical protein PR202_ga23538 [Eleusine coracana subsp. coracana]|uniref:Uncharacterized protein n=1 Tax=Eleusine coracana subsp. coracana TaxID=191504 RepID=A0AAV5D637_ELECO|nr:hypothetical protein PR202_ga23538 [Eleusine coracana subsp. coracana]